MSIYASITINFKTREEYLAFIGEGAVTSVKSSSKIYDKCMSEKGIDSDVPKKGRGRPKKEKTAPKEESDEDETSYDYEDSDSEAVDSYADDMSLEDDDEVEEVVKPKKKSKPVKQVEEDETEDDEEGEDEDLPTLDDIRDAARAWVKKKGRKPADVEKVFIKYGVKSIHQLKPAQYNKVLAEFR